MHACCLFETKNGWCGSGEFKKFIFGFYCSASICQHLSPGLKCAPEAKRFKFESILIADSLAQVRRSWVLSAQFKDSKLRRTPPGSEPLCTGRAWNSNKKKKKKKEHTATVLNKRLLQNQIKVFTYNASERHNEQECCCWLCAAPLQWHPRTAQEPSNGSVGRHPLPFLSWHVYSGGCAPSTLYLHTASGSRDPPACVRCQAILAI